MEKNLVPCVKIVDPTEEEIYYGIQAFKGTSQLDCFNEYPEDIAIIDNNIEIEDDEWEEQATSPLKTKIMCQGLSSLMSAYQSSSEEEDIENSSNATTTLNSSKCILKPITSKGLICENKMSKMEEIKCLIDNNDDGNSSNTKIVLNSSTCTLRPITTKGLVCENKTSKIEETKCLIENNDDDSGPESAPIERSNCIYNKEMEIVKDEKIIVKNEKQNSKYQKRKHSDDRKSENHSKKTPRLNMPLNTFQKQLQYYKERPSTLLEKLLEKDIRHERNIILQCVNYIVKNDFFKK